MASELAQRFNKAKAMESTRYEQLKARMRQRYSYARDKGFTPTEARILSTWAKETIDKLASEFHPLITPGREEIVERKR